MRTLGLLIVAAGVLLAACSTNRMARQDPVRWYGDVYVGELDVVDEPLVATLSTTRLDENHARSTVTLRGRLPQGEYPWFIHVGACELGSDGPILGNPDKYPLLTPDAEGNHTATANLDVALEKGGEYFVAIHNNRQTSSMTTIVGCGQLQREGS